MPVALFFHSRLHLQKLHEVRLTKISHSFRTTPFSLAMMLILLSSSFVSAQTNTPANANGLPKGGAFTGSSFDTVQMNNGNLHIEIPFNALPGRGISQEFKAVYDNKGWGFKELRRYSVDQSSFKTIDIPMPSIGNHLNWTLTGSASFVAGYTFQTSTLVCAGGQSYGYINYYGVQRSGYFLQDNTGTRHAFQDPESWVGDSECGAQIPRSIPSTDGSGWLLNLDAYGKVAEALAPNGFSVSFPSNSGVATSSRLTDTNGNFVSDTADTVGRSIAYDGSIVGSDGTTRGFTTTTVSVPVATKLCPFHSDDTCGRENTTPLTLTATIASPTGSQYVFGYEQNAYGELNSIQLPTGGVITYTWGSPDEGGRKVASRTVSYGGKSYVWRYVWNFTPYATTWQNIMTDPNLNDTVYTCQSLPSVVQTSYTPQCFITREDSYEGSQTGGILMKSVLTDYSPGNGILLPPLATKKNNSSPRERLFICRDGL